MVLEKDTKIVIDFLKENHQDMNERLLEVIESSQNGIYIISDQKISFSKQAKKLLNVKNEISKDSFYRRINLQDKLKVMRIINEKRKHHKPYEVIYRYKVDDEYIWIKEHGICSYQNSDKRLALITNITNQVEQDKKLHRLAFYDHITKLKNRNYFNKDIHFLINYHVPFALFIMDLNSFKLINDNFGHLFGDYILKSFSSRINNELKIKEEYDFYRLSGDEFAMVFPYLTKQKELERIINQLNHIFETPFQHEHYQISITPSIGISVYPKDSTNPTTLLKYADISMYRAKNESFNNYCFFNKNYYQMLLEENSIENHIKQLIKKDLLKIRYQPIFDITNMEIICLEALFYDDRYNLEKVFDIALKSHLIVLLEKKIIETVLHDIKQYHHMLPSNIRITINLTPKTAEYIDVFALIKNYMKNHKVDGSRIGIEITEQYFVKDEKKLNDLIKKLQTLGIKIYLDDYGMGFSSVRNLTYLNYDHIKIDKRMIGNVFHNDKCKLFIKSMIQYSKEIDCDIIIEGVETKDQMEFIRKLGVHYIQGYYLSKPKNINDILENDLRKCDEIVKDTIS